MKITTKCLLTIFGILNISKLSVLRKFNNSHIAAGIHGSYLKIIKVLIDKINKLLKIPNV